MAKLFISPPFFESVCSPPRVTVNGLFVDAEKRLVVTVMRNDYGERARVFYGDFELLDCLLLFLKNRHRMSEEALKDVKFAHEYLQEMEDIYFDVNDKFLEEWAENQYLCDIRA